MYNIFLRRDFKYNSYKKVIYLDTITYLITVFITHKGRKPIFYKLMDPYKGYFPNFGLLQWLVV